VGDSRQPDFEQRLIGAESLPLRGKHILFTTPRDYAGTMAELLIKRGAVIIWMPTIAIWPLEDYSELDAAIDNLAGYDWVAFSSESGIEAFSNRFHARGLKPEAITNTRLAAMKNDGRLLEKLGFRLDLKPRVSTPEAITTGMVKRGFSGQRILLPVPEVIGIPEPRIIPDWVAGLTATGMQPHRVPAYQTVAQTEGLDMQLGLLRRGEIEVIAFTSTAEITSLMALIDQDTDLLNRSILAYNGPGNSRAGRELGLNVDIVPEQYDLPGFVTAIENYFLA